MDYFDPGRHPTLETLSDRNERTTLASRTVRNASLACRGCKGGLAQGFRVQGVEGEAGGKRESSFLVGDCKPLGTE